MDESGWVIEWRGNSPLLYFTGNPSRGFWSQDNLKAVRFSRHQDACAVLVHLPDSHMPTMVVADHLWVGPRAITTDQRDLSERLENMRVIARRLAGYLLCNNGECNAPILLDDARKAGLIK